MPGITCPKCGAFTDTKSGYCDVCRSPLPGYGAPAAPASNTVYGAAPAPREPAQPQTYYQAAPAYGAPAYGAPAGYAGYPQAPGYGAPAPYYPAPYGYQPYIPYYGPTDPQPVYLAKQASGARWGAAVIDALLVVPIMIALFFLLIFPLGPFVILGGFLLPFVFMFSYYSFQDGGPGRTLGKRAMGLVVVNSEMKRITMGQGIARVQELWLWMLLGILICAILQSIFINDKGQSMGDKFARCYVVKIKDLGGVPAKALR